MMTPPSISAYDREALRLLSGVLFDVKRTIESWAVRPFTEGERTDVTRAVADRLMRVFDTGERDPRTLKRAAMEGLSAPLRKL